MSADVAVPTPYIAPMGAKNTESAFWDINVVFEHRKLPICSDSVMWNTDELGRNKEPVKTRANFCTWRKLVVSPPPTSALHDLATQQSQCRGKIDLAEESPSGQIRCDIERKREEHQV